MQHPQNDPSRVQHVHLSDVCARSKPVTESAWSEVAATYDVEKRVCKINSVSACHPPQNLPHCQRYTCKKTTIGVEDACGNTTVRAALWGVLLQKREENEK